MLTHTIAVAASPKHLAKPQISGTPQRACACGKHTGNGGECAEWRQKRLGLQRRAVGNGPDVAPPIVHGVLRSPGRPLDDATRGFMESRFGHDFSGVRVHTGGRAAESAQAVNALAYTVGNHVAFDSGQYAPGGTEGKRLLAHELTHVVQQQGSPSAVGSRLPVGPPRGAAESEAGCIAAQAIEPARSGRGGVKLTQVGTASRALQRAFRPWPLNGRVINVSHDPVTVWSDGDGLYTIAPGESSHWFSEDVDHVRDSRGQWYKVGVNTTTVYDREVINYACAVNNYGEDCP